MVFVISVMRCNLEGAFLFPSPEGLNLEQREPRQDAGDCFISTLFFFFCLFQAVENASCF